MFNSSGKQILDRLAAIWGGTLGFVVGACLTAWFGKLLGWWPPGEKQLHKYLNRADD